MDEKNSISTSEILASIYLLLERNITSEELFEIMCDIRDTFSHECYISDCKLDIKLGYDDICSLNNNDDKSIELFLQNQTNRTVTGYVSYILEKNMLILR